VNEPAAPEALRALTENHRAFLSFLEHRVGDRATAEDILQDAFVRGMERLGQLWEGESAVAWFYRLLRNAVVDHYRRRASSNRRLEAFAAEAGISETNAGVRVFRAREALRREVERSCRTCATHGCLDCTCGEAAGGATSKGSEPAP